MKPISSGLGALLAQLERRTQETLDLTKRVRSALSDEEKIHVVSASYRDDTLVIVTDSAAWGSRIHFLQETLKEQLQTQGETQFTKVQVKVGRPG
ncbi:DciA family protein [Povalibacter sp.]|uniref:DciA family protein n=1 Tax=Povalibacter sp. TaxID=1962978 RepID=UPI002F40AF72